MCENKVSVDRKLAEQDRVSEKRMETRSDFMRGRKTEHDDKWYL